MKLKLIHKCMGPKLQIGPRGKDRVIDRADASVMLGHVLFSIWGPDTGPVFVTMHRDDAAALARKILAEIEPSAPTVSVTYDDRRICGD